MRKIDVVTAFKDAVSILKLDKIKMSEIYSKKSALTWALIILVGPFVLNAILISIFSSFVAGFYIKLALLPVLSLAASSFVMALIAQFGFKTKVDYLGLFKVMAYAALPMWAMVVFMILSFAGISGGVSLFSLIMWVSWVWMVIVAYNFLMSHFRVAQKNAMIICGASVVGFMIVQSVLGRILLGGFYSVMFF